MAPQGNVGVSANNDPLTALDAEPKDLTGGVVGAQRLFGCELQVSVAGYQPLTKTINNTGAVAGIDAGTLMLTPIAGEKGTAISVTSALAPKGARKEYEKGEQELSNSHLESAAQHFEKAVSQYDKYAAAWNELLLLAVDGDVPPPN